MTTYRYINRDHSLVLRDDHVIAWDADAPKQADEVKLWKDAVSLTPAECTAVRPGQSAFDQGAAL